MTSNELGRSLAYDAVRVCEAATPAKTEEKK